MRLETTVTEGIPNAVISAMASAEFAGKFLDEVVGEILGAKNPRERPAEYYVQKPDFTIGCGPCGVELRLTGVSRDGRKASQFHQALTRLHELARSALQEAVNTKGLQIKVQFFVAIMLDSAIETAPGSGKYSNILESEAEWVETTASE